MPEYNGAIATKFWGKIKTWAKILHIAKLSFSKTGQNNAEWEFQACGNSGNTAIVGQFWRKKKKKANLINNSIQLSDEAKQNKIWNGKPIIQGLAENTKSI